MWIYNERDNIISDKAYMPDSADVSCWREITEVEKKEIEARLAESEVGDAQEYRCRAWRISVNFLKI